MGSWKLLLLVDGTVGLWTKWVTHSPVNRTRLGHREGEGVEIPPGEDEIQAEDVDEEHLLLQAEGEQREAEAGVCISHRQIEPWIWIWMNTQPWTGRRELKGRLTSPLSKTVCRGRLEPGASSIYFFVGKWAPESCPRNQQPPISPACPE